MRHLVSLVVLVAGLGAPGGEAAQAWQKYVAKDRSYSFHYPAGWAVQIQGTAIQISHAATKRQILVILVPNAGALTTNQLASQLLAGFRKQLPDMKAYNWRTLQGGSRFFEATWSTGGVTYRGFAIVVKKGQLGFWASFSTIYHRYKLKQGWPLVQGVTTSLAQGTGSRRPTWKPGTAGGSSTTDRRPATTPAGSGGAPPIRDRWFLPPGRTLRGFYGGAVRRKNLVTFARIGSNLPGSRSYHRSDQVVTGGDFRIAFYTNGTIRAKLLILNYSPMFSTNVAFRYEGRYTLSRSGRLTTRPLRLANRPKTFIGIERTMTKLRIKGRYDRTTNTFQVQVSTYNPRKGRWWTVSKGVTKLARASRRETKMYGTVRSGSTTTTYSR